MRPPFRPLSVFPFPSTDNLSHSPVSAPSSRSGVNRVHLLPSSFVSRNCTRKNISPMVGYRDSSRVSDRKRLRRRLRDRRIELRSSTRTFPTGERISPSNPPEDLLRHRRSAYKSPVPDSQYVPRSPRKILAARSPHRNGWRVYESRRRGSRGIEKRAANPCSSLSLSRQTKDRERRGGRGRERARVERRRGEEEEEERDRVVERRGGLVYSGREARDEAAKLLPRDSRPATRNLLSS